MGHSVLLFLFFFFSSFFSHPRILMATARAWKSQHRAPQPGLEDGGSAPKGSGHKVTPPPRGHSEGYERVGRREGCSTDVWTGQIFINKHQVKMTTGTHHYTQGREMVGVARGPAASLAGGPEPVMSEFRCPWHRGGE